MKLLTLSVLLFSFCAQAKISSSGEDSRFGLNHIFYYNSTYENYTKFGNIGVKWVRPITAKPITWGNIQASAATSDPASPFSSAYNWTSFDNEFKLAQDNEMHIIGTIFPYADYNQTSCNSKIPFNHHETELGEYRQLPCSTYLSQLTAFINNLVEYYNYDGTSDWSNAQYAIKYWEIANEPALFNSTDPNDSFFYGNEASYAELFNDIVSLIRAKDSNVVILNAGLYASKQVVFNYWSYVFADLTEKIDVFNYHSISDIQYDSKFYGVNAWLTSESKTYDVWLTELQFSKSAYTSTGLYPSSFAEGAQIFTKRYLKTFASGVEKIFLAGEDYDQTSDYLGSTPNNGLNYFSLISCPGEEPVVPTPCTDTAVLDAFETLIDRIDYFTSVVIIAPGIYKFEFAAGGKHIYPVHCTSPVSYLNTIGWTHVDYVEVDGTMTTNVAVSSLTSVSGVRYYQEH